MTALESQIERLQLSIKHNEKVVEKTQRLLDKEKLELKKLEKRVFVCPACNKIQELKSLKTTKLVCRYCGYQVIKS